MQKTALTNEQGHVVGQDHHRAKLSDHDIWLIHELRAVGVKRADIADKMEVSVYTVIEILSGRRRAQIAVSQKLVKPRRT
jgi:CRP-like cAMP-binding protein